MGCAVQQMLSPSSLGAVEHPKPYKQVVNGALDPQDPTCQFGFVTLLSGGFTYAK
jgi:hypothetical protein